jgi:U6 snRNA-associated Sm-like protein LSm8
MASFIESLIEELVSVITTEGRVYIGILKSFDQSMNIVLTECYERVYSADKGVETIELGLYMIRGDTVAVVSEPDENLESSVKLSQVKAEPMKEMKIHN